MFPTIPLISVPPVSHNLSSVSNPTNLSLNNSPRLPGLAPRVDMPVLHTRTPPLANNNVTSFNTIGVVVDSVYEGSIGSGGLGEADDEAVWVLEDAPLLVREAIRYPDALGQGPGCHEPRMGQELSPLRNLRYSSGGKRSRRGGCAWRKL